MRKSNRFTRIVVLVWLVVAVLVATGVIRAVTASGMFASTPSDFAGICRAIPAPAGSGSLALDAQDHWLFLAASDRRKPNGGDGLYALNLADAKARPVKLMGAPADYHPHALALYREMGALVLGVIHVRRNGHFAIDMFDVDATGAAPRLRQETSIESGLLTDPSALALLPGGRFYVANATASSSALGRAIEKYGLWPRANLLFFNGASLKKAVDGLSQPSGVLVSPSGVRLYIASANERRVLSFGINPVTGDLSEMGSASLGARPGELALDGNGNLVVAAQPKLALLTGFDKDPAKLSPSVVYRIALGADGAPTEPTRIYGGDEIGGATSAVMYGKRLLIGAALDSKLLDCTTQ